MKEDIVEQDKEIISVGELNRSAKYLLENTFNNIAVVGEISNMSRPSSGHIYFTLKDEDGAIGCAMWRSQHRDSIFHLKMEISASLKAK